MGKRNTYKFLKDPDNRGPLVNLCCGIVLSIIGVVFLLPFFDLLGLAWTVFSILYTGMSIVRIFTNSIDGESGNNGIDGEKEEDSIVEVNRRHSAVEKSFYEKKEMERAQGESKLNVKKSEIEENKEKLRKLKDLLDEDLITEEEYQEQRKKILEQML